MNNIIKNTLALLLVAGLTVGCEDFLEPSVDQNRPTETAVQSVDDLNSLVLGAHDDLNRTELYLRDFVAGPEASTDNAFSNQNSGRFIVQSRLNYTVNSGYADGIWDVFYESIATTNIVINSNLASSPAVDYAKGQAYALRAFNHMNLLLTFGQQFVGGTEGIPYITTYNQGNLYPARESVADVWTNIGNDFAEAVNLMDPALDAGNPGYINSDAVRGLLSRYHLYTGNFDAAISNAEAVVGAAETPYAGTAAADLAADWADGSGPNSLFEIVFTTTNNAGNNSLARIYRDTNYGDVEATQDLYDAYDAADARRGLFTVAGDTIRLAGKYVDENNGTDNVRVVRWAEVWLNKAEALARRGTGTDLADAITMINALSSARGSGTIYTSTAQADVIADVLAERRLELAFEGHRFFDLARHGLDLPFVTVPGRGVNYITGTDIPYGNYRFALPIPQAEMDANSSMTQNSGYN